MAGDGVLRLELGKVGGLFRPRTLPLANGILWPLLPLWLLFVRWRWLPEEFSDDVDPDASGRAYGGWGGPGAVGRQVSESEECC